MPRLLTLLGVIIISFSAIFVRLAEVTPTTAAFFRTVYAIPFLALLWWWRRRDDRRDRRLRAMAFAAVLGQVLLTMGLGKVPAARGTALSNLQVAFALLYGILFFSEIPTWITIGGAVIIVCAQLLLAATRCERLDRMPAS